MDLSPQLVLLAVALTYPTLQAELEYWRGCNGCSFFSVEGQSRVLPVLVVSQPQSRVNFMGMSRFCLTN